MPWTDSARLSPPLPLGYKRSSMKALLRYLVQLKRGKIALWCYLIWYLVTVAYHFDPQRKIWLNALGISAIIGTGLYLSVAPARDRKIDRWQLARLFMMPFCVSSFSALIKDRGFVIIFSPNPTELLVAIGLCTTFIMLIVVVKLMRRVITT